MCVTGLMFAMWLAVWSGVASAMPAGVARPSYATVQAIKRALGTPYVVVQHLRDNSLTINSLLTGKNETLLHLIAGMPDDGASLTALDHVLEQEENTERVELNAADSDGQRPLHHAVKLGKHQTVFRLLGLGARVNLQDSAGKSPIDYAEEEGHTELVSLLQTYAQAQGDSADAQEEENTASGVPEFLVNLNELAAAGELDPVVGRVAEIMSVLEALSKRRGNNPLLVGEAGVGKTAIAEGIADLIVREEVPKEFIDKTLYNINIGTLNAGTGGRGTLEERVDELIKFADTHPDALFFIDEVHLIAAGAATGGIDLASLLKPYLEKGRLPVIGATTDPEYRRHILSDKALKRRFSVIRVVEPNKQEALEVALAARDRLAAHHGLEIMDDAVIAAVELAHYLPEQKLPDVALALLDEAAAALNYESGRIKLSLTDIAGKITRRSDSLSWLNNKRKKQVASEIRGLENNQEEQNKALEKHIDTKLASGQEEISKLEADADTDEGSLSKAYRKLKRMMRRKRVEERHIAELIARKLDIPVEKILKTEQDNVANLEENLKKRIFGQDKALTALANTLTVSYAGLGLEGRTLGAFMMTGPTGVGKTHTAQMLAEELFGDKRYLLRFDMSEYAESHTISTLLGAPPGYVGYEQGGTLTSEVLRMPHAVILFDEIEKAHPQFQNILLQILEGARLTDRSGETVDFSNVIVMMTNNSTDLEADFRPEVRNRIDNILHYEALGYEVMEQLVQAQLSILNERLQSQKLTISLSARVSAQLGEDGYDPANGARPLQRVFRQLITLPLSKLIVRGELEEGNYVADINENGKVVFQSK